MTDPSAPEPHRSLRGVLSDSLLWRLLTESLPEHRGKYLAAIAAMVVVAGATALTAWVMGAIVDSMTDTQNRSAVYWVAAAVAGIFFVKGIASFAQNVLLARAGNRIVAQKQMLLYNRIVTQDVAFFNATHTSDVLLRVTQSAQMARSVIDTIVTGFVRDLLTLLGLVAVMFYQQPVLSLVSLIVGPAAIFGVQRIVRRVHSIMAQEMAGLAEIIKVVQETATGARVVKAFALEHLMTARMDDAVRGVEQRANKMVRLEALTTPLMDTITGLAIAAIVVLSAVNVFGQAVGTPGQLMSFVTAFLMAYEPAKRLSRMRVSIEAGMYGVRMMYSLLDQPATLTEAAEPVDLPEGPSGVALEGVSFSYPGARGVFSDLTLSFPAGTTTALVGPSGGGKSTLLNLILRLYDPDQGRVLIDGIDLRAASFASLRRKIAYVGQDTFLFATSVMENLRIVRPDATDAEVREAARIANADEFILGMPKGYDTPIGENGLALSGGQRQRLAIARAVLRGAPILLLDEATSALDAETESRISKVLDSLRSQMTVVLIAHRLSTVMNADKIIYLDNGEVVAQGNFAELKKQVPDFAKAVQL
ncbi:MAG: ABC transporter ATP-binding protein, partial [Gemmobacter sp.]